MRLGPSTWSDIDDATPRRLLIPLGATEQHGPHLPLQTDTLIAVAIAEAAVAQRRDVVIAPALPYGASGEHAGFPGTLSLGRAALEAALVELIRSADHFDDVILVSWHGGNRQPVDRGVTRLRGEGRRVSAWQPQLAAGDAHAGRTETSLMLVIAPALVSGQRPAGVTEPVAALMPALREQGVRVVSPTGVLGDARGASAVEGGALLAALAADLEAFLAATPALAATR